jgi:exopolyphosphatase/guanosine-5'-triphosphate,3'-diphosphate pyrophosphatase
VSNSTTTIEKPAGKHIAAVDMGTNSFHMIIAETTEQGAFRVVDRMKHWVRLGDGADSRGRLDDASITRMIESLTHFKRLADGYGAPLHCIATSAMRDAPNRNAITHRIRDELDLIVEIINGDEEARLVFQGVRSEGYIGEQPAFIIDIGGGSTEVIVGNRDGLLVAESLDMGARRHSRQFFASQKYTTRQLHRCSHAVAIKIQSVASVFKAFEIHSVYGTSGTIRTLSEVTAFFCDLDDPAHLKLSDLKSIFPKLIKAVKDDTLPDTIERERQETLVAGAIILEEVMSALKIKSLRVCPSALREGIIFDRVETSGRLPAQPIQASANAMVRRFNLDKEQINRVTTTAELIFNSYADALKLNHEAYRLLMAACQLHEIGLAISHRKIHLYGGYIIANANMTGITQRQQQILAATVRFHRKASPSVKHVDLKNMRGKDARTSMALAAILRMAAALNRTKDGEAALPRFEEKKKAWQWIFDDQLWFDQHEVCIWNGTQEKHPISKLLGKPVQLKNAKTKRLNS